MTEREYYEMMADVTANGNCDRCTYGSCGECHIQCNKSFDDYMREERGWLEDGIGF